MLFLYALVATLHCSDADIRECTLVEITGAAKLPWLHCMPIGNRIFSARPGAP